MVNALCGSSMSPVSPKMSFVEILLGPVELIAPFYIGTDGSLTSSLLFHLQTCASGVGVGLARVKVDRGCAWDKGTEKVAGGSGVRRREGGFRAPLEGHCLTYRE